MTVPGRTRPGVNAQVAVVDDDLAVRRALARLLRTEGYGVWTFSSAEEFLRTCGPDHVDCLVLDLYLGGMTGLDLHEHLAAAGAVPPTVFVTAHDETAADPRLSAHSESVCLRKPIEDVSLLAAVDEAIRRGRAVT